MGILLCVDSSDIELVKHYEMIHTRRYLIESKLNELNLDSNNEMQKNYINDNLRKKTLRRNKIISNNLQHNVEIRNYGVNTPRSYRLKNGRIITPRGKRVQMKISIKKTFGELLNKYYTDPWMIKSPHINRIKKNNENLKKINEEIIEI